MVTAAPNPNLIAFVGDLHGQADIFEQTVQLAAHAGATTIIQCGDFGFYRPASLDHLQMILDEYIPGVDFRFIDGNHENFRLLNPEATEPTQITKSITHMPRGSRATLAGVLLLFCGGATSTDRHRRTEGVNWFPDEHITDHQTARAVDAATDPDQPPVDILITHDTTTAAFTCLAKTSSHAIRKAGDPLGEADRAHIDQITAAARPTVHIHGHHHTRFAAPVAGVLDVSLAKEDDPGAVVVLDTHDDSQPQTKPTQQSWSWSVPVYRLRHLYNDDRYRVGPYPVIETEPLLPWADVKLAAPAAQITESTPASTVESVTAHRMILQMLAGTNRARYMKYGGADNIIDTAASTYSASSTDPAGPEPEVAAAELKGWMNHNDIDNLAIHLLDPREQFNVYRELSPIIERWGTDQIRLWAAYAADR